MSLEVTSPENGKNVFTVDDRTGHVTAGGQPPSVTKVYKGWAKVSNSGTDVVGTVTLRADTTPVSGPVCDVAFHSEYVRTPVVLVDSASGGYAVDVKASGFTISAIATPAANAAETFSYLVVSH